MKRNSQEIPFLEVSFYSILYNRLLYFREFILRFFIKDTVTGVKRYCNDNKNKTYCI